MMNVKEFDDILFKMKDKGNLISAARMIDTRIKELCRNFMPGEISTEQLHAYAAAFQLLAKITYNELPDNLKKATDLYVETAEVQVTCIKVKRKEQS